MLVKDHRGLNKIKQYLKYIYSDKTIPGRKATKS